MKNNNISVGTLIIGIIIGILAIVCLVCGVKGCVA